MRPAPRSLTARRIATLVLGPALAVALAACSSADPGWTFAPVPSVTPPPSVEASAPASPAESAPAASPEASAPAGSATAGDAVKLAAQNIAFSTDKLQAPAGAPFVLEFENLDAGIPHNVEIKDAGGTSVYQGEIFNGIATKAYEVAALAAGSYPFICTVHPNMTGTLTVE